jgi:hypothetical protein
MNSGTGGHPLAGGTGSGGLPVPLYLIHTTKPSNPSPVRVSARFDFSKGLALGELSGAQSVPGRTAFQTLHLVRLNREFGVDISGAERLTGPVLDEWLNRAEDSLFQSSYAEYRQQRQGGNDAKS